MGSGTAGLTISFEHVLREIVDPVDAFTLAAAEVPSKAALVTEDGEITFSELVERARRVANRLVESGLSDGRLAVVAPREASTVELLIGARLAGCSVMPVPPHVTEAEATALVAAGRPRAVLAARPNPFFRVARQQFEFESQVSVGDAGALVRAPTSWRRHDDLDRQGDSGMIFFTSGTTTGRPKAVVIRSVAEHPIVAKLLRGEVLEELAEALKQTANEHRGPHLVWGPLWHGAPVALLVSALAYGRTAVLSMNEDPRALLRCIEEHRVETAYFAPVVFHSLLGIDEAERRQFDTSSLRKVVHSAAPCPVPVKRAMIEWLGPILYEGYGSTEMSFSAINSTDWLEHPGSVGKPFQGVELKIVAEDGSECPRGTAGRIYARCSFAETAYLDASDEGENLLDDDWRSFGDMGYIDADGWLYLVGRTSDLINVSGSNVYPKEVEDVLSSVPGIREVVVVGIPTNSGTDQVVAVVVPKTDEDTPALLNRARKRCSELLSKYKHPVDYVVVHDLPRTANGKILRREIRAMVVARVAES